MADPSIHYLRSLSYRFPTVEAALGEIAHLRAVLTLPRGTVHVVSDVHGEFRKLEHILRNGSGTLRPLVDRLFSAELDAAGRTTLLNAIYYPRETFRRVIAELPTREARDAFVQDTLRREFSMLRELAARFSLRHAERVIPREYAEVFRELLGAPVLSRDSAYVAALLSPFLEDDGGLELLRATSHAVRSFAVYELILGVDLGDRGPRVDSVIETLRHQNNLSITLGNHDANVMG